MCSGVQEGGKFQEEFGKEFSFNQFWIEVDLVRISSWIVHTILNIFEQKCVSYLRKICSQLFWEQRRQIERGWYADLLIWYLTEKFSRFSFAALRYKNSNISFKSQEKCKMLQLPESQFGGIFPLAYFWSLLFIKSLDRFVKYFYSTSATYFTCCAKN